MEVLEKTVQIVEYNPDYQKRIEQLILPIQTIEFKVPITREEQPDLMHIQATFQQGAGNFWVALWKDEVVGTIGIVDIGENQVALKKMFVRDDFRGKDKGVAASLMGRTKEWRQENGIETILLGTVDGMKAAHRFYEKNGFVEIARTALPNTFPIVTVDTKFYSLKLPQR
jgi:GNAT superfamily N-acetyltransferase